MALNFPPHTIDDENEVEELPKSELVDVGEDSVTQSSCKDDSEFTAALNFPPHTIDDENEVEELPKSHSVDVGEDSVKRGGLVFRLYLVGVTPEHTESEMTDYFGGFGSVTKVDIVKDRETGAPRGFAFVHFSNRESLEKCLNQTFHTIGNSQCSVREAIKKENTWAGYQQQGYHPRRNQMHRFQQQPGGFFFARSPNTLSPFRHQPYQGGLNMGYNDRYYGSATRGAYPGSAYGHVHPAMQQYQTSFSGYGGASPAAYNSSPAGDCWWWPQSGKANRLRNAIPVQGLSSYESTGSNAPDMKQMPSEFSQDQSCQQSSDIVGGADK